MLRRMGPGQFNEWIALYQLDPFGDDWEIGGMIAAMMHNTQMGEGEPISRFDLIPSYDTKLKAAERTSGSGFEATWRVRLGTQ